MGKPLQLDDTTLKQIADYLYEEYQAAYNHVYQPYQRKIQTWDDQYYGVVPTRPRKWLSNFPVLLGATFTDATLARFLNTIWAYKPFWIVRPTQGSMWQTCASALEQYLDLHVRLLLPLYPESKKALFECVRYGTGALLTPWHVEKKITSRKTIFGWREYETIVKQGIKPRAISMREFVVPGGFSELEELPWWARQIRMTPMMARQRQASGYMNFPPEVLTQLELPEESTQQAQRRAGQEPQPAKFLNLVEFWFKYDLAPGQPIRLTALMHVPTRTIGRIELDTYPDWPLELWRFGNRDFGIYGLGTLEMTKPYDDSLYALYNTLVDNFKIATMQCLGARKGQGVTADTEVYPGKIFMVNDQGDLWPLALGQPYNLNPAFTRSVWELAERRAGVTDYALGRESPIVGSRATATGTLALIQEGQRRFDMTIRDIRYGLDRLGMRWVSLLWNQGIRKLVYATIGAKGRWVDHWLQMPAQEPYLGMVLECSVAHAAMNKETEKQNAMQTMQVLERYYQNLMQLIMMMGQAPPQVQPILASMAAASSQKVKRVLEAFGEPSPEALTDVAGPLTNPEEDVPPPEEQPSLFDGSTDEESAI